MAALARASSPTEPVAQEHPGQLGKQPGRDNQLESLFQQQIEELRGWFPWASISAETNTPGVEDNAGHYMALARLARYASNSL
jgi:hypothetical protein